MKDSELRGYLLGQMSEAEAAQLEERFLVDEDLFQTLRSVEDDLFDDYARGGLTGSERERFAERHREGSERLRFARALTKKVAPTNVIAFPRRRWIPWAAAAAIAVAIGGTQMIPVEAPSQTSQVQVRSPRPAATAPFVSLVLALGASRSARGADEVTLPQGVSTLRLRLRLDPADRFDAYAMELRSPSGQVVWRGEGLTASTEGNDFGIDTTVPTAALAEGTHELAVRGVRRNETPEDLGFVTLKVHHSP